MIICLIENRYVSIPTHSLDYYFFTPQSVLKKRHDDSDLSYLIGLISLKNMNCNSFVSYQKSIITCTRSGEILYYFSSYYNPQMAGILFQRRKFLETELRFTISIAVVFELWNQYYSEIHPRIYNELFKLIICFHAINSFYNPLGFFCYISMEIILNWLLYFFLYKAVFFVNVIHTVYIIAINRGLLQKILFCSPLWYCRNVATCYYVLVWEDLKSWILHIIWRSEWVIVV